MEAEELLNMCYDLTLAYDNDFKDVICESDSLLSASRLNCSSFGTSILYLLCEDITHLFMNLY